jgi:hypothetical protein
MNLARILAPCLLAGVFYLLGSWGAMSGLARPDLAGGDNLRAADSFSQEAIATASIVQMAQAFRLEFLESTIPYDELRNHYERGFLQWLKDSGKTYSETTRQEYHARTGPPPQFDVDTWIARYRDAIARFPVLNVTELLESDLLSILRRHRRDAEFHELYLQILQRGASHPAIARQARFAVSSSVGTPEADTLLCWIRHLTRFETDERRAQQLDAALNEWLDRNSRDLMSSDDNQTPNTHHTPALSPPKGIGEGAVDGICDPPLGK